MLKSQVIILKEEKELLMKHYEDQPKIVEFIVEAKDEILFDFEKLHYMIQCGYFRYLSMRTRCTKTERMIFDQLINKIGRAYRLNGKISLMLTNTPTSYFQKELDRIFKEIKFYDKKWWNVYYPIPEQCDRIAREIQELIRLHDDDVPNYVFLTMRQVKRIAKFLRANDWCDNE
jgi:hypothetical protein